MNGKHIVFFVNTPAQVHFLKNIVRRLVDIGHNVTILSRDYGETQEVLIGLGISHTIYSKAEKSKKGKLISFPLDVLNAYNIIKNGPSVDLVFGFGITETYVALLLRSPVVIFTDSEPMVNNFSFSIQYLLFLPFVDSVITPESFRQNLGRKHIKVNSFKELAYLHPNYFKPNDDIYSFLGINKGEKYAILRFNAFDAVHDAGITGFNDQEKVRLVIEIEKSMKVFVSSEGKLPESITDRMINIPKSRIHDALYFSQLFVTDTQTMATEAAYLGVPTIRCNRFVGKNDMGNFNELENKYGLIFNYSSKSDAINMAIKLLNNKNINYEWQIKKEAIIRDKFDINEFIIKYIETRLANL